MGTGVIGSRPPPPVPTPAGAGAGAGAGIGGGSHWDQGSVGSPRSLSPASDISRSDSKMG